MRLLNVVVQDGEEVYDLSEVHLPILLLVNPLEHFLTGKQIHLIFLLCCIIQRLNDQTWYSSAVCPSMVK